MRSVLRPTLACALLLSPAAGSAGAEPVLREVLLTTGGVGYLGFQAAPDADGRVRLTVPLAQVDDILKSLTVLGGGGADGGAVRSVDLLGPTPLADLFRGLPFGEGDLVDLPRLLLSLRGAEVSVAGPAALRGRILAVAEEQTVQDGGTTTRHRLSLAGEGGVVRSVILESVEGLAFTDPELARRTGEVLARLASGRGESVRELEIALDGTAGVGLGYLAEMPVWKASWRLVAGEANGRLQGWAILENASGQDWRDVAVTLVGGSPRALRQALFASHYVARPEVPVGDSGAPKARQGPQAAAAPEMAADTAALMVSAPPAPLATGGAQELTAQTLFPLPRPVTLAVGRTAMAPIVDRTVPVERVALYRAEEGGRHPSAALRLRNTAGVSLPAGLTTLYQALPGGGLSFLGDAPLPQTAPGADELLVYGRDGNVEVDLREEAGGRVDRARIADGVLELTRVERRRFAYAVAARFAGAPRAFVLEQARPADWRVAEPADAAVVGDRLTVRRELAAGGGLDLAVVLERPVVQRFGLLDHDADALLLEFEGVEPPPELRAALARLGELSGRVADVSRGIGEAEARRDELGRDQGRLRENLAAVPPGSDLARRYLAALAASEDELAAAAARLADLRAEQARAEADRAAFVRSLRV